MEIINNYKDLFNSYFGDDYIITGSVAIRIFCEKLDIKTELNSNDIDILYVNKSLLYNKNIGEFTRKFECPTHSLKFINNKTKESIDITTVTSSNYCIINNLNILHPAKLKMIYEDNKRDEDIIKIELLDKIIELTKDYKTFNKSCKRKARPTLFERNKIIRKLFI